MTATGGYDKWVKLYHPRPAACVRLVCFPHAGGAASYYAPMSGALRPHIELAAIQYPGRQDRGREQRVEDITALADQAFDALRRWRDRPLTFFGHSMGAIVAYEVARRFAESGTEVPQMLFVSARREPSRRWNHHVHLLDDAGLVAELRRVAGPDQRWLYHEKLLAAVLPTVRSDYKAIESYSWSPGPPLNCSITGLVGDNDPYTTADEVAAWEGYCTGEFELKVVPGGHFYLETCGADIAAIVSSTLRQKPRPSAQPPEIGPVR